MTKRISASARLDLRLVIYTIFTFLLAAALLGRLFQLQILRGPVYAEEARDQHAIVRTLDAHRGEIMTQDKDGFRSLVAANKSWPLIYAIPKDIENPDAVGASLAEILGIPLEEIQKKIRKPGDPYEPLLAKANDGVLRRIREKSLPGVGIQYEEGRYYPQGRSASHLIGFVGYAGAKRVGQYGIEEYYDDALEGKGEASRGEKSGGSSLVALGKRLLQNAKDGSSLILTIDQNIQFKAEEILRDTFKKWSAESGTVIVSEPKTGKILAMASLPDFDPNSYGSVEGLDIFLNPAIQRPFEPGSVFKPITMSAALDTNAVTPETTYTDTGREVIGGFVIQNFDKKSRGVQTMTQVLEKSLNTGAIFAEQRTGHEDFLYYVEQLGFGEKTGIDLAGEARGSIENLFTDREVNYATASFGQGISVTPIQIVRAIGAIANGGKLMKPYVVEKIISPDGEEHPREPEVIRQVMAPKTAYQLTAMMASVIENGVGRAAALEGYTLAGKTGTAQIPDPEKSGYSDEVIHSFAGFGPASDPQFLIFLKLERPHGIRFAASSLSRPFRDLAEFILRYYEIPPE